MPVVLRRTFTALNCSSAVSSTVTSSSALRSSVGLCRGQIMPRMAVFLVPQPLYDRLMDQLGMVRRRPTEAEPHYWLGMREHRREDLRDAITLDRRLTEAKSLPGWLPFLADVERAEHGCDLSDWHDDP